MSLDGDRSTDEYIVTALQIFHYCGANSTNTLRVDDLIDKFAPFVKTNKAEYSYLRSLLDPDQSNPEITVSMLASTLNKYSENQKIKVDLDESFNLKSEQGPHDSDSGISTDGFQLLEELQCELREKSHLAHQLRTQLEYSDRHHEEALAALSAERDTLRAHLNMLRDESSALGAVRRDYEEACERLCGAERALGDARRDLDAARRAARVLTEQVALLETEKLTLQELLSKSKEECHRINDMYASRQSTLLVENETLRTEHAHLTARLQDQDEFMQHIIKEKDLLEMELKDLLNKSNQTHLRLDRSIDVSYTEDQMLTALDTLSADSRFTQEGRLLDEESFVKALREDQGRVTNMSLFDEIRLSFCNMSRHNLTDLNSTQPSDKQSEHDNSLITAATQTENELYSLDKKDDICICKRETYDDYKPLRNSTTQTDERECYSYNKDDICSNDDNIKCRINYDVSFNTSSCQTIDFPLSEPYAYIHKKQYKNIETQDKMTNTSCQLLEVFKDIEVMNFGTQTDAIEIQPYVNNNNDPVCIECHKCVECDRLNKYITKLERELKHAHYTAEEMQIEFDKYEINLNRLKRYVDDGHEDNRHLKTVVDSLRAKLDTLEGTRAGQGDKMNNSMGIQTESEQSSVSTQADIPCTDCTSRVIPHRGLGRYFWEPLRCAFQLLAALCFVCALCALCGVSRARRACREPLPWRWLQPHDLLDLLLSVEYVADVPM
ncbi:uncharacterized protein LOC125068283 isoform X1 [Vanessa atalanta]|uniref:uncharacterized protein LOC125068283 isoform X1 n=2 Tax=Vanessa atalanta TaxID=42275 RepID=UPI001FCD1EEB|nr:uncharacterized protein LOC125068283 isoform X1 [Vanessa atalanta]